MRRLDYLQKINSNTHRFVGAEQGPGDRKCQLCGFQSRFCLVVRSDLYLTVTSGDGDKGGSL